MSAATLQVAPPGFRSPLVLSAIGHGVLALLLSTSLVLMPEQPLQQLAIEAVVVDQTSLNRAAELEQQAQQEAAQRQLEQRREQQRQQELVAQRKADAAAREKRAAEQRAEQQQREKAEQQAAERKRQAAEQAAKRAAEQKAAAARARAAAEKREQDRRQAELAAALAEEEALFAARQSGEMSRYMAQIQARIMRKWQRPASAVAGVDCEVWVKQLPSGDVIDAKVTKCNGDETVRRSIENAVRAASPLPRPENPRLFDRNPTIVFRPDAE